MELGTHQGHNLAVSSPAFNPLLLVLASGHSSFITGAVIPVDGGWTTV